MRHLLTKLLTLVRPTGTHASSVPHHAATVAAPRPVFRAPPLHPLPARRPLSSNVHRPRLRSGL